MDQDILKKLWARMGNVTRELAEVKRELLLALHFNKHLVEENDRLQTELMNVRRGVR